MSIEIPEKLPYSPWVAGLEIDDGNSFMAEILHEDNLVCEVFDKDSFPLLMLAPQMAAEIKRLEAENAELRKLALEAAKDFCTFYKLNEGKNCDVGMAAGIETPCTSCAARILLKKLNL